MSWATETALGSNRPAGRCARQVTVGGSRPMRPTVAVGPLVSALA
jgi:hypothetical protein